MDFLYHISSVQEILQECMFMPTDIVSLYRNIPNHETLDLSQAIWDNRECLPALSCLFDDFLMIFDAFFFHFQGHFLANLRYSHGK